MDFKTYKLVSQNEKIFTFFTNKFEINKKTCHKKGSEFKQHCLANIFII